MSGLYNVIFGQKEYSDEILATLGFTVDDVGRFRDAWVEKLPDENYRIAIYTRNGGGNRDHWEFSFAEHQPGETCPCAGCKITHVLPKHPLYIEDRDDTFDCTYATIYFKLPDNEKTEWLKTLAAEPIDTGKIWEDSLKDEAIIRKAAEHPAMKKIFDKITGIAKGEG